MNTYRTHSFALALIAATAITTLPSLAADIHARSLVNADKEPHNWLMNHRNLWMDQRHSPVGPHQPDTVKNLKLAYAVSPGWRRRNGIHPGNSLGKTASFNTTDSWGVLYKIDVTSGTVARIVWRMDPSNRS